VGSNYPLSPAKSCARLPGECSRSVPPQRVVIPETSPETIEGKPVACVDVPLGTPWKLTPLKPYEVFRLLHAAKDAALAQSKFAVLHWLPAQPATGREDLLTGAMS
jgi:hypothetical protein